MSRIHIFCALPFEAEPVIRVLGLGKSSCDVFRRYEDARGQVSLVITGTGKARMASAVGYEIASFGKRGDLLINAGIAGASSDISKGEVFLVNKITDMESGRSFYPDVAVVDGVSECEVACSGRPLRAEEIPADSLADMESAAFYEAASLYTGPHNIQVVKAVSDNGDFREVTKDDVAVFMENASETIKKIIRERDQEDTDSVFDEARYEELCIEFSCTEYMRHRLKNVYIYAMCENTDLDLILKDMREEGLLPTSDKKSGMKALSEIQRRVALP